jgi:acetyl esterase/lipase
VRYLHGLNLQQLRWALEEKMWARRSSRRQLDLNRSTLPSVEEGVLRFGEESHQALIWFAPKERPKDLPVVLFVHGGGWQHGDASWHRFVGRAFASSGFAALVTGYRLAPAFRFPAPLEDLSAASHWERSWHGSAPGVEAR